MMSMLVLEPGYWGLYTVLHLLNFNNYQGDENVALFWTVLSVSVGHAIFKSISLNLFNDISHINGNI